MASTVGKIKKTNYKHTYYAQWEIEEYFTSVAQTVGTKIDSPPFYFANATWILVIEPNGSIEQKTDGWLKVSLILKQSAKNFHVDWTVGIHSHGSEKFSVSFENMFLVGKGWAVSIIERSKLYERREELVPGGTLTLFCRASVSSEKKDGVSTLSEDIKSLFINEKNYDATIKVKDRSFKVHKLILGSRSPVLYAMFDHDMKESNSSTVSIDDCEPEIFHDFLLFLYSEKTSNLSSKNVSGLYYLADKYLVGSLKEICLGFMITNLNIDNICEILTLADLHHEEELMETASKWAQNNLKAIVRTDKWVNLMSENADLAAELLRKAMPD